MKKIFLMLSAMLCMAFMFYGCSEKPQPEPEPTPGPTPGPTPEPEPVAVTGISISPQQATLLVGETLQLTATVSPADATDKTVTWSIASATKGAPPVAEVSSEGLVTAGYPGSCFVVATCGEFSASCLLSVRPYGFYIWVYNDLDWEYTMVYGHIGDDAVQSWHGLYDSGSEEINGHTLYMYFISGEWCKSDFSIIINDNYEQRCPEFSTNWELDHNYYFYVNGPFDENGYATLEVIDDPDAFEPQPYVPEPDPDPTGCLFYENFDNGDSWLSTWTFIDADGDGHQWMSARDILEETPGYNESYNMLLSQSYINGTGALTPDNWIFTPAITLSSKQENYLSYCICGQDSSYAAEHYAAYITEIIPTEGDIASQCTKILEGTVTYGTTILTKSQSPWEHYCAPLPDEFKGKTVYIAFRHYDCTDNYFIDLDDVMVTTYDTSGE